MSGQSDAGLIAFALAAFTGRRRRGCLASERTNGGLIEDALEALIWGAGRCRERVCRIGTAWGRCLPRRERAFGKGLRMRDAGLELAEDSYGAYGARSAGVT